MPPANIPRMGRKPKEPSTDDFKGRFAARLRELQTKRFETQDAFREELQENGLEVSKPTVSEWLRGDSVPQLNFWPIIARTLKVKVRSLLPSE